MKNRIKELRTKEDLTLEYLSFVSKVSVSYLNKLEKGLKNNPSNLVMQQISNALNKPIKYVFYN